MKEKKIRIYKTRGLKEPFNTWLTKVKDKRDQMRIRRRIDRLELGLLGDCKHISKDLFELKCHFGPGYRIYCTERNDNIIILLLGGNKRSQNDDIKKARTFISDLQERNND